MTPPDLQTPTAQSVLETLTHERPVDLSPSFGIGLRGGRDTKARMAGRPGGQLTGDLPAHLRELGRDEQIGSDDGKRSLKDTSGLSTAAQARVEAALENAPDPEAATIALADLASGKASKQKNRAAAARLVLSPGEERRRTGSHYAPRWLSEARYPELKRLPIPICPRISPVAGPSCSARMAASGSSPPRPSPRATPA